ncbi:MAG TPA: hypothetical protein VIL74_03530 [Pyrinomonadaceae bacterium]|jgi:hypothetical protein
MTTEPKDEKELEEEREMSPHLQECCELPPESLGAYLLNYLNELKSENKKENNEILDRDELIHLLLLLETKVKRIQTDSMKNRKLRRDLESQFNLLAKKFNDIFFPSEKPKPRKVITITFLRRTNFGGKCIACSTQVSCGWQCESDIGQIYFCLSCKEEFLGEECYESVDMWSKMVFSAFESNRRKH